MFGRPAAGRAEEAATIRWLLAGQLLMFCGIAAIFPVAPLYVEAHGGGAVAAALFIAGALLANAVVQIPAGRLVDRIGRRPFLLGGRIVFAILSLAIFFLDFAPLWVLAVLRTAMGAASGAYIPALLATITDLSPPARRAERFSQLQAAELVGLLVGPLIGGLIALWNPSGIFLIAAIGVGAGVLAQRNVPETRGLSVPDRHAPPLRPGWWRRRGIVVAALGVAAVGTAFSMYDVVWPLFLSARGASTLLIGVSITLFAIPMLVLATPGGRLADRGDRRVVLGICFAVTAMTCATYPFLHSIPVIIGVGFIEAIGFVMCEPSLYATIGDSAPAEARGRAMGIGGTAQLGGSAFGAAALGSLYGLREGLPFWCASAVLVSAAVLCALALPPGRGRRHGSAGAEPGGLVVDALQHSDDAFGADVDRAALGGQLDEVEVLAADGQGGDRVGHLEVDQDVGAVHEAQ